MLESVDIAAVIAVGVMGAVLIALPGIAYGRSVRRFRREHAEWWAAWKQADRPTKRRVGTALRRGQMLTDPDDARLLVGLAESMERFDRVGRWRWGLHLLGVIAILSMAALGDVRRLLQLAPLLLLVGLHAFVVAPLRRRRQRAVARNRHLLSRTGGSATAHGRPAP